MSDLEHDVQSFLSRIDALAERLNPQRRPEDADAPECSPRELKALTALGRHGRLSMTLLAELLDVPLSTATRTVERLAEKGLVERTQSSRDRRVVEVNFAERGEVINRYVSESRTAEAHAMLGELSEHQRAQLLRQLARLLEGRTSAPSGR